MTKRLTGLPTLSYLGVESQQPPNIIRVNRNPTTDDYKNFTLGDMWIDYSNPNDITTYILVKIEPSGVGTFSATWSNFSSTSGELSSLTGNSGGAVYSSGSGNINLLGANPIAIAGTPASNLLTVSIADASTAQKGVGILSTDAQAISGTDSSREITPSALNAKLGAQTANGIAIGAGTTAAIAWTSAGTDGQALLGATGSAPAFSTLTSTDGSISFIPGTNTLDISVANVPINVETFTPELSFDGLSTGITYAQQTGHYYQVGIFLFYTFTIELTSKGTATGLSAIGGLPVASAFNGIAQAIRVINFNVNYATDQLTCFRNNTLWNIQISQAASFDLVLDNTQFTDTSFIQASGVYVTS